MATFSREENRDDVNASFRRVVTSGISAEEADKAQLLHLEVSVGHHPSVPKAVGSCVAVETNTPECAISKKFSD